MQRETHYMRSLGPLSLGGLHERSAPAASAVKSALIRRRAEAQRRLGELPADGMHDLKVHLRHEMHHAESLLKGPQAMTTTTTTTSRPSAPARVKAEEPVYHDRSEHDFLKDVVRERQSGGGEAAERLARWAMQQRDASTASFPGAQGSGHVAPDYVALARAGAAGPFASVWTSKMLPDDGIDIDIHETTTGTSAASPTGELQSVSDTDLVGAKRTIPVVTVATHQDVSFQLLDRGIGARQMLYDDMARALDDELDRQLLVGIGTDRSNTTTADELDGILKADEILAAQSLTRDESSPDWIKTFQQAVKLRTMVKLAHYEPTHYVMHPRREEYLLASAGSDSEPFVEPGRTLRIGGLPVVSTAHFPTTRNTSQDGILCVSSAALHLFDSGQMRYLATPKQHEMTAQITCLRYCAAKLVPSNAAAFSDGTLFAATVSV